MRKLRIDALCALAVLGTVSIGSPVSAQSTEQPRKFPVAKARFEQNATDGDVEVVFEISGRKNGLTSLQVKSPDGRLIVDFKSHKSGPTGSGIRQFVFESPEPTDVAALKKSFPEGSYSLEGRSESGDVLRSKAELSHKLPETTTFVIPQANAKQVRPSNLKIQWKAVPDMAGYIVELEQEDADVSLLTRLPASATSFAVPEGFLSPGAEYQLGIGTVGKNGNISFVETSFTTETKR